MFGHVFMRAFAATVIVGSVAGAAFVYAVPPPSLRMTRDGVPHFTPPVAHPQTGEPLDVGMLARHYKGVK